MAHTEDRAQRSLRALLAMGHILATTSPYERVVAGMIATVSDVLDVETCGFFLHDIDRDELVLQRPGFDAYDEAVFEFFHLPLSRPGPTRQVFLTGLPAVVNDALEDPSSPWFYGSKLVNARTVMVVPLMTEGRGIGVLSITNKRAGKFEPDDVELAMLLAPHLALTIDAAAKHKKLEEQQQQLARALQVHAELSKAIVSAPHVGPLAESLARLLRRPVLLLDAGLQSIAYAGGSARAIERELVEAAVKQALAEPLNATEVASLRLHAQVKGQEVDFVVATIAAGEHLDGYVAVVEAGAPLDVVDIKALEHAATLFAFQLLRERTALDVERRVRGELFQELLSTAHSTDRGSATLLERLGASATGPWRVVRLELVRDDAAGLPSGSAFDPRIAAALATAWADTGLGAPLAPWGSGFASVIPDRGEQANGASGDERARLAANLREALAIAAPELHFILALGSRAGSPKQLTDSFQQAEDALALAIRLSALDRVVLFEELGIERVLLDSIDTSTSHESFVQQVLGPLLTYDAAHQRDLLATLKAYIEAGYTPRPAAQRLFIHVNTLRFRLKRIADLLSGGWPHGQVRFQVELALRLLDLQALRARQHARARIAPQRPVQRGRPQ